MANELKPCPFCGGEAELDYEQGFFVASGKSEKRVAIYCTKCDADMGMCYSDFPEYDHDQMAAILADKWNTRPAAPVEGVETAGYRVVNNGLVGLNTKKPDATALNSGILAEELVKRSQAEAIIAAKDARIAELKKSLTDREWISNKHNEHRAKYKADNATLTARVKGLEAERGEALKGNRYAQLERIATKRAEALETQLAAAEGTLASIAHTFSKNGHGSMKSLSGSFYQSMANRYFAEKAKP